MKYALIDVGSNTIRLTVNLVDGQTIQNLFHKKTVAGLASYVSHGALTAEGIRCVCEVLQGCKTLLSHFEIDRTSVFATASLRNVSNTDEALNAIAEQTGYHVDLISGEEEAILGYYGICQEIPVSDGLLLDIGGGSTEITLFHAAGPVRARSFPVGSLNLYTRHIRKNILPSKKERESIKQELADTFTAEVLEGFAPSGQLYAVGGSARAILKFANHALELPDDNRSLTGIHLKEVKKLLFRDDPSVPDRILKQCPDRIHTLIPGFLIFHTLFKRLGGETVTVCRFGVREGYLWDRYMREDANGRSSHVTGGEADCVSPAPVGGQTPPSVFL